MSNAKQEEQQQCRIQEKFEKYSKLGDPDGIFYIVRCLMKGTVSVQSLITLCKSGIGKKQKEVEVSILLLSEMGLISVSDDFIEYTEKLSLNYNENKDLFCNWFVDELVEFVMVNKIIDIETISYEISSDTYYMSPTSIKQKFAGFRNMLVEFNIISLRSDAHYNILQKIDEYIISRPEVKRNVTEKQLYAQLQKRKELGAIGEEWVLNYEKKRITNSVLKENIKQISLIDVSAGFDITSYNDNNSTEFDRFIEVKTYKGKEHFHWSHNEIEKANLMGDKYYIYLVDADCLEYEDYEPQIIQNPIINIFQNEKWAKRPDSYLVERIIDTTNGHKLPLFTNLSEPRPVICDALTSNITITTSEIKIDAKNIQYISEKNTTNNKADNNIPISTLSEEKRNAIFKISLEQLFKCKNDKEELLFSKQGHWQAIFRVACEKGFATEKDYKGFEDFINKLTPQGCMISFDYESLKKADVGIFCKPIDEWTFELYKEKNMKPKRTPFDKMLAVGLKFKELLNSNCQKASII